MKKMMDLESMLMKKDNKKEMSETEAQAKMDVLMELMEMCQEMMGDKVKSGMDEMKTPKEMQQVTVAAPDKEGLSKGLEKAEELMETDMEAPEEETEETEEEQKPMSMASLMKEDEDDSIFSKKK